MARPQKAPGRKSDEAIAADAVDGDAAAFNAGEAEGGEDEAGEVEDVAHEGVEGANVRDGVRGGDFRGVGHLRDDLGKLACDAERADDEDDGEDDGEGNEDEDAPAGAKAEAAEEDGAVGRINGRWDLGDGVGFVEGHCGELR